MLLPRISINKSVMRVEISDHPTLGREVLKRGALNINEMVAPYLKALRWSIGSLAPIPSLSDPLRVTLPPLGDTILRGVAM